MGQNLRQDLEHKFTQLNFARKCQYEVKKNPANLLDSILIQAVPCGETDITGTQ